MGEIADMMLDGTLCQGCGVYLEDGGAGFPMYCAACQSDQGPRRALRGAPNHSQPRNRAKVACEVCGRHVKKVGLAQHIRDAHLNAQGKDGRHEG